LDEIVRGALVLMLAGRDLGRKVREGLGSSRRVESGREGEIGVVRRRDGTTAAPRAATKVARDQSREHRDEQQGQERSRYLRGCAS